MTFYLTKTENKTKKLLTQHNSHTIALSKDTILAKQRLFLAKKNADISKIKKPLVVKDKFSETAYVCVLVCQICNL